MSEEEEEKNFRQSLFLQLWDEFEMNDEEWENTDMDDEEIHEHHERLIAHIHEKMKEIMGD